MPALSTIPSGPLAAPDRYTEASGVDTLTGIALAALAEACKAPEAQASSISPTPGRAVRTAGSRSTRARPYDEAEARRLLNEGNQKLLTQDPSAAVALFQKALTLKPDRATLGGLYRSMGIAFTRQGNIEEGAHYYRLYLPLCTNPAERAQLQKVLDDYEARRR